jgi:hypothetical protein
VREGFITPLALIPGYSFITGKTMVEALFFNSSFFQYFLSICSVCCPKTITDHSFASVALTIGRNRILAEQVSGSELMSPSLVTFLWVYSPQFL